jgi:hypothetical protein
MKKALYLFLPFIFKLFDLESSELEKKYSYASEELELSCSKCDKYILTMRGKLLSKSVMLWQSVVKPSAVALASDSSDLMAIQSLPAINCSSCKSLCFEPTWHRSGDKIRVAYKVVAAKKTKK